MAHTPLAKLLEQWEQQAATKEDQQALTCTINTADHIRLKALASTYNLSLDEVITALLHTSLNEIEQQMPYVPGTHVIRVEDGENIYEDIGPMPRYLAAQKSLNNK
ncbi:hypothetical protein [Neptunomonas marina]|uniref:Type 1 pili tip component n=1 Tax=Neptunomonas marina TaxID=1815562 RepID=A0A437QC78_9GAMM|nr:hypothetical protein [Neptunomonas marina]RVU32162.1 hypothetical protein EOE65_00470 [Neptunomonas marina]